MTLMTDTKFTIVSLGHVTEDYLSYIKYLLFSLRDFEKPEWIFLYDNRDNKFQKEDLEVAIKPYNLTYKIVDIHGGSLSAMYYITTYVETPYVFYLEHDWVFLKEPPSLKLIASIFDKYEFVKKILFKKDGNNETLLWANDDGQGNKIPFVADSRIKEANLIQACYWSNNPHMIRVDFLRDMMKDIFLPNMKELYENRKVYSKAHGVEEPLIDRYINAISVNPWDKIKDQWGTYIYGDIGETTYIAHTDASKRYDGDCERLAKNWIRDVYNIHCNSM